MKLHNSEVIFFVTTKFREIRILKKQLLPDLVLPRLNSIMLFLFSPINTYQGIRNFWKETGADSVMIARAAEWNPSVFSPNGKSDIYQIVDKYLDYAIKYDQPFIISKYNIQQHLGGDQVISWNFCCSTKKNYFLRPL